MVTQIIIPGIKDSQNRDPSLVLIELQGLLESDQPDLRGAHVGELEQDSKASVNKPNWFFSHITLGNANFHSGQDLFEYRSS